jgi:hypothetical protein
MSWIKRRQIKFFRHIPSLQSTSNESDVWLTSVQLNGISGLPAAIKWNTHGSFCCPTTFVDQHNIVPKSISYEKLKKKLLLYFSGRKALFTRQHTTAAACYMASQKFINDHFIPSSFDLHAYSSYYFRFIIFFAYMTEKYSLDGEHNENCGESHRNSSTKVGMNVSERHSQAICKSKWCVFNYLIRLFNYSECSFVSELEKETKVMGENERGRAELSMHNLKFYCAIIDIGSNLCYVV